AVIALASGSSRGKPADAPPAPTRDAAVTADAPRAPDAPVAIDAAPPADAPAAVVDAGPVEPPRAPANPFLAAPGAREQLEKSLKGIETSLPALEKDASLAQQPLMLESTYAGAASLACMLGDGAKAGRYYAKLELDKDRKGVERTCESAHTTLRR
ncbi:MAG: hypothetical protein ACM31C_25780, partial [Acidobacteriota bacterium]